MKSACPLLRRAKIGRCPGGPHVQVAKTTVFLLSVYDQSDRENIPDEELRAILAGPCEDWARSCLRGRFLSIIMLILSSLNA